MKGNEILDKWPEAILVNGAKLRLSPSKMIAWDECKARFKNLILQEVKESDTIYTCIGKAAHSVLERINKGEEIAPAQREILFKEYLIQNCAETETGLSFPNGFIESRETLKKYEIPAGWEVFQAEGKQVLEFPRFDFSYIADIIYLHRGLKRVKIRDYKTSAKAPKSKLQLMCYGWAVGQKYPELYAEFPTVELEFHMLRKDKVISHIMTAEEIKKFDAYMHSQVELMAQMFAINYFPTNPGKGGEHCHWCPLLFCPERPGGDD